MKCEYVEKYGTNGVLTPPCEQPAIFRLMRWMDGKVAHELPGEKICVCATHAEAIMLRFPDLGRLKRFDRL